jgi:hypothetical protein
MVRRGGEAFRRALPALPADPRQGSEDNNPGRSRAGRAVVIRSPANGVVMSGCRPLIKGYFGVALVVGAVMSSAFLRGEFESAGPDVVR